MNLRFIPLFAVLCLNALPRVTAQVVPPPLGDQNGRPFIHQVFEKDRGRMFSITPSTTIVDANSDLVVSFQTLSKVSGGSAGLDWQQATNALNFIQSNSQRRREFTEKLRLISLKDENDVKGYVESLRAFNRETIAELRRVREKAGLSAAEWDRILDGDFDGNPTPLPYANLGRWLTNKLSVLQRDLVDFTKRHTVQVSVQAFHLPRNGMAKAVHVDNYDQIPAGEYRPIDRLGLKMNEAERQELAAKIQAAETAASTIREIKSNSSQLRDHFKTKLQEIRNELEKLEKALESDAADWQSGFENTEPAKALRRLADDSTVPPAIKSAAAELLADLKAFNEDFERVSALYRKIGRLVTQLRRAEDVSLSEVIGSIQDLTANLDQFMGDAKSVLDRVTVWTTRLNKTIDNIGKLADRLAEDVRSQLLPKGVQDFVKEFGDKFPATMRVLQLASTLFKGTSDNGASKAEGAVANMSMPSSWLNVHEALPAVVELSRTGLAPGDSMKLKVSYREVTDDGSIGRELLPDEYKVEAALIGLHREFDASVIFARGLRGNRQEQSWKPNVAATVSWHYLIREEENERLSFGERTWNWMNPGIGLHLASLDQGADSIEFGAGVNISLWDGVLQGGYGFNISNNEHPYVFFGIGLLQTLEKARSLKKE